MNYSFWTARVSCSAGIRLYKRSINRNIFYYFSCIIFSYICKFFNTKYSLLALFF